MRDVNKQIAWVEELLLNYAEKVAHDGREMKANQKKGGKITIQDIVHLKNNAEAVMNFCCQWDALTVIRDSPD